VSNEGRGLLRQGDVLLVPVGEIPDERPRESERQEGRLVLAVGEATGHAHAVVEPQARLVVTHWRHWNSDRPDRRFLVVEGEPVRLVHEEHLPLLVGPGIWEVRRQREYRPRGYVRVAD
jgi:hypothetical protein